MPVAALHLLDQFIGPARRKMPGRIGDLENCDTHGECAEWRTNRSIPFVRPRTIPGLIYEEHVSGQSGRQQTLTAQLPPLLRVCGRGQSRYAASDA